jgi:transketolase
MTGNERPTPAPREPFDRTVFDERARRVRHAIMEMIAAIGHGHVGGSMSAVEILITLYYRFMRVRPAEPQWEDRDRFILSKGHAGPALYAVLASLGYLPWEELLTLNHDGARLPSHVDRIKTPGVDMSAGSLGQGLSPAIGMAYGLRLQGKDARVYALIGDGESDEGQIWEAAMSGAKLGLDNLVAITDYNGIQLDGTVGQVMPLEPLADKWRAFGWRVFEADGHDWDSLYHAIAGACLVRGQPSMVLAHTVKGKGVSWAENVPYWHAGQPTAEQLRQAFAELAPAAGRPDSVEGCSYGNK